VAFDRTVRRRSALLSTDDLAPALVISTVRASSSLTKSSNRGLQKRPAHGDWFRRADCVGPSYEMAGEHEDAG
jgi:hypothetical protein